MVRAHHVPSEDPALAAAYARARATFGYFWREQSWEHRRIVPGLDLAAVKAAFADGDTVEHLWVGDVAFDGITLTGTAINEPFELTTVRAGDAVAIDLDDLEDWMFAIGGVVHGGHTIAVIRASLGRRERRAHDRGWGLTFPDDVLLAHGQAKHPEHLDDHPMCINTRPEFAAALQHQRHLATDLDEEGFTMLQREAIAGNAPIVTLLLAFGADPAARSPRGLTAVEHAERLGWTRVVEALRS
jgi:uncharacterized protein YegJ (DUF2314 family)